jgi:MFS superfamily sulfate permease-like transporter
MRRQKQTHQHGIKKMAEIPQASLELKAINSPKPENGINGFKHWKEDMLAGLIVSLVSVPLSLGIALASGAPPICGITSEIVAGIIFPFLGGAYVAISGPAAGLAPALFAAIASLGHGNMETGYHNILSVIFLVGILQILLSIFKAAKYSHIFPTAAVQGMLVSIGLLLIGKELPHIIGHKFKAHEFFGVLLETPSELTQLNPTVFLISIICLMVLFGLPKLKIKFLNWFPIQLLVVLLGGILAKVMNIAPNFLVSIPANPFAYGIALPNFGALIADHSLWMAAITATLVLTFIDATEGLATVKAVDHLDPYHRKSSPDRILFSIGFAKLCSSLIGGLTVIPGIIKSSTCIHSGGRTAWVNFYNAVFLIIFLLFGQELINHIPVCALAAILVHIGFKLAGPHKWQQISAVGKEQVFIFAVTIFATLATDLLVGIFAGMAAKVLVLVFYSLRAEHKDGPFKLFLSIFKDPLECMVEKEKVTLVLFNGPLTCFNSLHTRKIMEEIEKKVLTGETEKVILTFKPEVSIVDHSMHAFLDATENDFKRLGKELRINGLEELVGVTSTEHSSMLARLSH